VPYSLVVLYPKHQWLAPSKFKPNQVTELQWNSHLVVQTLPTLPLKDVTSWRVTILSFPMHPMHTHTTMLVIPSCLFH